MFKIYKKPCTVIPRTTQSARTVASRAIKEVLDTSHNEDSLSLPYDQYASTLTSLQKYYEETQKSVNVLQLEIDQTTKRCQTLRQFIIDISQKFFIFLIL